MCFKLAGFPQALQENEDFVSECFDRDTQGTLLNDLKGFKSCESTETGTTPGDGSSQPISKGHMWKFSKAVYQALSDYCADEKIKLSFTLNPTSLHL